MNTRTRNHLLWSLLLFSAAVRMFFYFQLRDTDLAAVPLLDSETYHDWAARLAADGVFGMIYAGLGLNEQVLQEGERAPDAFPANQDRWIRQHRLRDLAYIQARTGNEEAVLDLVEQLLQNPSNTLSSELLSNSPLFDLLRENPRIQALARQGA